MRRVLVGAIALFSLVAMVSFAHWAYAEFYYVGFLSMENGLDEEEIKAAYDWCKKNYRTVFISPDGKGGFVDSTGGKQSLTKFAVLWFEQSTNDTAKGFMGMQAAFTSKNTIDAILDYLKEGGTMLAEAEALYYVYNLGLEPNEPRKIGAWDQAYEWSIIPTEEHKKHPIFKGFEKYADPGGIPFADDSMTSCADFLGFVPKGEVLADACSANARTISPHFEVQ